MTLLAESLRSLARGPAVDPADAQVLASAATALESGIADPDLLTIDWPGLLADVDRPKPGWTRLANVVEAVRDGGFVAPIAFLWFDLRSAVDAYNDSSVESFFSQWQDGFGNETRTFGSTAIVVLAILAILALLSIGLIILRGRARSLSSEAELANRRLARQVQFDLAALVPAGDKAVHEAARAARKLATPIANLTAAADRIAAGVDPLLAVVAAQAIDIGQLKVSIHDMVQTVTRFETSAVEFQRQAAADLSAIGGTAQSTSDAIDRAAGSAQRLEAILGSSADLARALGKAAHDLETSTANLTATAESASRMFANLRMLIADLEQP